ncbi:MAG: DUF3604 domain-containing protein [Acidobacteria bacterium]|nr:DUF3604 domain-containing protein [Acidobacteriota bacterium]
MRVNIGQTRIVAAVLVIAVTGSFYVASRGAQSPGLEERISKLRAEIDSVPTVAGNYDDRVRTLIEWGDILTTRGRLIAPQDLSLGFYRLRDFNTEAATSVKNWTKALGMLDDKGDRMGSLVRTDSNDVTAGQITSLTLVYTVGDVEIPRGNGLVIGQNFFSGRLQSGDPTAENYVTFKVESKTAQTAPYTAYWRSSYSNIFNPLPVPGLRINSGALKNGDKGRISIGVNGPGYRPNTRDADDFRFLLAADFAGDGVFVPAARTSIKVMGDAASLINAVVPSVVGVNESFAVKLRIEDQFWNPASKFPGGKFNVRLNGRPLGVIDVAAGEYLGRLDGVKIPVEGGYKLDVSGANGRFSCVSNPVLVERNPQQRIYWGDLHGHSGWEEGTGTVPRYYEYARDYAMLDFASLTGHDAFLFKPGWEEIRRETEKANRSGSFVAYMGYEWTQTYDKGGHHNVFFKNDKGRYVTFREAPRPNILYEKLRAIDQTDNVLIIPHAHEAGDWNYNDSEMERLVEIFSMHGSFEYFGQRYLKRGYRMGFVGASDDHTGHPGYSPAVIATRNGLAAVYSPGLDRDGIWIGMKTRATYATSNATRPVVKLTVDDRKVGEFVTGAGVPTLKARVLGTKAIDHIDVIHNNQIEYSRDYLRPRPNDPTGLQLMFFSPTEQPSDDPMPPKGGIGWGGWIEVSGGRIASIEPLNVDHFTDEYRLVDEHRIWFTCRTRGDFDGLLIKFLQAPADTQVKVIISNLTLSPGGTGSAGAVGRPLVIPGRNPLHEINFKLNDLAEKKGEFKVGDSAFVYARKARSNGDWDVSFSYRPTKVPSQDDFYYLRVVQIDGEAAWVSPIWIGEQTSKRKSN